MDPSEQLDFPEEFTPEETPRGLFDWLRAVWQRIPDKYRQSLEPEILAHNLLPEETQQLEIRLAWYRQLISSWLSRYLSWILFFTGFVTAVVYLWTRSALYALIPVLLLLFLIIEGIREGVEHRQWRLIKTDKRLIISLPQEGAWPLVDNIEVGDLPKVIDTNWSANPVWRAFQFFTGARDVYISLTAFKFEEGTARVRDALVIPDIMPDEVLKLKALVFGKK